jgi:hypothetical protein
VKHLAQALAILSKAENGVEASKGVAVAQALEKVEFEFAERLRLIKHAKRAIQMRFASKEAVIEEYFGELKADTPRSTTIRIRRSQRKERSLREADLQRKR